RRVLTLGAADPEAAADEPRVCVEGVAAGDCHDQPADDEGEEDRAKRHRKAACYPAEDRHRVWRQAGRLGTGDDRARPLRHYGMSAGGGSVPAAISPWTLVTSACMSAGSEKLSTW